MAVPRRGEADDAGSHRLCIKRLYYTDKNKRLASWSSLAFASLNGG